VRVAANLFSSQPIKKQICGQTPRDMPEVQALLGQDRYNPSLVPQLEEHVHEQVVNGTYSGEANLTLLRNYACLPPHLAKVPVITKILLKALAQLHEGKNDFTACCMLLSEKQQADETLSKVVAIATALRTARFSECWALVAKSKDLLSQVPGMDVAMRKYALHVITVSYRRVQKRVLGIALNLAGGQLDALVALHVKGSGWSATGDLILLPANDSNTPNVNRSRSGAESIRFDQVLPVLRSVTVG